VKRVFRCIGYAIRSIDRGAHVCDRPRDFVEPLQRQCERNGLSLDLAGLGKGCREIAERIRKIEYIFQRIRIKLRAALV
jgi:hypothetical protein